MAIPITALVKYDMPNRKIEMNEDYNFVEDMLEQLGPNAQSHSIDLDDLSAFGAGFTREASQYMASLKATEDKRRLDAFFKQLYKLFQIKHQTEKQYEKIVYQQGLDQLKFELMKLLLSFESMPKHQKEFLKQFIPPQFEGNFKKLVDQLRDKIKVRIVGDSQQGQEDEKLDLNWIGTRMEVELP